MGAPKGNKNGSKGRPWTHAIEQALKLRSRKDQRDTLIELADSLITKGQGGDMFAIKEIGDRLEGKAKQSTELTGAEGGPVSISWMDNEKA